MEKHVMPTGSGYLAGPLRLHLTSHVCQVETARGAAGYDEPVGVDGRDDTISRPDRWVPFGWNCTSVHRVARKTASWSQPRATPGCTVSSLIIGEAALGLALDQDRLPGPVGVLTPATAIGTLLAVRLKAAAVTMTTWRK
jgi:hypothetical protein